MAICLRSWLLHVLTIMACTFCAARALASYLSLSLTPALSDVYMGSGAAQAKHPLNNNGKPSNAPKLAVQIISRNIFCSTCSPAKNDETKDKVTATERPSSLPYALLATLQVNPLALDGSREQTYAMLMNQEDKKTYLMKTGSWFTSEAQLVSITDQRVWISNGAQIEYLDLAPGSHATGRDKEGARPETPRAAPRRASTAQLQGIREVASGKYEIQRQAVNEILSKSQQLSSAQFRPVDKDGQVHGFMIHHIQPHSIFRRVGLENGDRIHAVNGHPITSAEDALHLYSALKKASYLTISLTRQNKLLNYEYTIR